MRTAQRLRRYALAALDRAVLTERACGATWEQVAGAIGEDIALTLARYRDLYERWASTPEGGDPAFGMAGPADLHETAACLDTWRARHAEPWDDPELNPLACLAE